MSRLRTTIYLGPQTRRLDAANPSGRSNFSREIEWAVDGFLVLVDDSLPPFRLAEWVAVVVALSDFESASPRQARFIGDELVRAHKRGAGKPFDVDLGSIGYRLGASPLAVSVAVSHICRCCRGLQAPADVEQRLRELLPAKFLKA